MSWLFRINSILNRFKLCLENILHYLRILDKQYLIYKLKWLKMENISGIWNLKRSYISNVFPQADLTLNCISLPTVHIIEHRNIMDIAHGIFIFLAYQKSIFTLFFKFHKINLFFF